MSQYRDGRGDALRACAENQSVTLVHKRTVMIRRWTDLPAVKVFLQDDGVLILCVRNAAVNFVKQKAYKYHM